MEQERVKHGGRKHADQWKEGRREKTSRAKMTWSQPEREVKDRWIRANKSEEREIGRKRRKGWARRGGEREREREA